MLSANFSNIVIFGGPSLSRINRKLIKNMKLFPPVKTGDLKNIQHLRPGICVILDGIFSHNRAISSYECIELINSGWYLIGASSMGALRAADLYSMGMIGLGEVYNMYRLGICRSDADVAVVYQKLNNSLKESTISMVHILSLLQELENRTIIDSIISRKLLLSARKIVWHERTIEYLMTVWDELNMLNTSLIYKIKFMIESQIYDPKKSDATEVLKYLFTKRWCDKSLQQSNSRNYDKL